MNYARTPNDDALSVADNAKNPSSANRVISRIQASILSRLKWWALSIWKHKVIFRGIVFVDLLLVLRSATRVPDNRMEKAKNVVSYQGSHGFHRNSDAASVCGFCMVSSGNFLPMQFFFRLPNTFALFIKAVSN